MIGIIQELLKGFRRKSRLFMRIIKIKSYFILYNDKKSKLYFFDLFIFIIDLIINVLIIQFKITCIDGAMLSMFNR